MLKRRGDFLSYSIVSVELTLLILSSVAISFLLNLPYASAADTSYYAYADGFGGWFVGDSRGTPFTSSFATQEDAQLEAFHMMQGNSVEAAQATGASSLPTGAKTAGRGAAQNLKGVGVAESAKELVKTYKVTEGNFDLADGTKLSGYQEVTSSAGEVSYRGIPAGGGDPIPGLEKSTIDAFEENGAFSLEGEKVTDILGLKFYGGWGHLVEGAIWAGVVVGAIQLIAPLLGADSQLTNTLSVAALAGIFSYKGILAFTENNFFGGPLANTGIATYAPYIGIGVAVVTFILLYKKESTKIVQLQCLPWEAPLGGKDCEKCNGDPLRPCSEYRCKSLGQACELVNKGSAEERCTWVSRSDVSSPTITPIDDVLTEGYQYTNHDTRPPSLGAKIQKGGGGCVAPYTPLRFGIATNEPAQCKIDYTHRNGTKDFDDMQFYFGESNLYSYNHTQTLRVPSVEAWGNVTSDVPELKNDGTWNYFVRCRDANGNENVDEFVFTFCVDKSPDTTPPVIESTSILSGSPVSFGSQNVDMNIYVNEPAECKWSTQDKSYQTMENSMTCSKEVYQVNAQQLYPCSTTLTGIKDSSRNNFFFRCKDQPFKPEAERNVNAESYPFMLRGSQALSIVSAGPNGTITGSTSVVSVNLSVRTDDGSDEGKAICYFSPNGQEGSFITMFSTNSYQHSQLLTLPGGSYTYSLRCIDAGGNADVATTSFSIFTDRSAPLVTRAYKEGVDALKIVTNEDAECSYSLQSCNFNFDEAKKMIYTSSSIKNVLFAPWDTKTTYYIKCRDNYGNMPSPNSCSIVASATSIS